MSIAVTALWVASFVLTYTFPLFNHSFGAAKTFWIYAAICVAGFLFVRRVCRKPKGRPSNRSRLYGISNQSAAAWRTGKGGDIMQTGELTHLHPFVTRRKLNSSVVPQACSNSDANHGTTPKRQSRSMRALPSTIPRECRIQVFALRGLPHEKASRLSELRKEGRNVASAGASVTPSPSIG